jgi:predicted nucleic acid-binding protein
MCVIIDSCVAVRVLVNSNDPDFCSISEKIHDGALQIVYGGELRREYIKTTSVTRIIGLLDRAGIAKKIHDSDVDAMAATIKGEGNCTSNDTHVIALAIVSKARLICTADQALHVDFKNSRLLAKPRGKIYQTAAHKRLLKRKCNECGKIG